MDKEAREAILRVVAVYALFGASWILFSDRLLFAFVPEGPVRAAVSVAKGWLFVAVTSALLASLVGKEFARRAALLAELQARLAEKEVLLREVHHRVKNNLQVVASILSLERGAVETEADRAIIDETIARVSSMALVHERLFAVDEVGGVELQDYLASVAEETTRIFGSRGRLELDLAPLRAGLDLAAPLGLVVAEALANASRHGAGSALRLGLSRKSSGHWLLEVRDGGPGFPPAAALAASSGVGLKLLEALASQAGGRLELSTEGGAVVRLSFPEPKPAGGSVG